MIEGNNGLDPPDGSVVLKDMVYDSFHFEEFLSFFLFFGFYLKSHLTWDPLV